MFYYVFCRFSNGAFSWVAFPNKDDVVDFLDKVKDNIISLDVIKGEFCFDLYSYWRWKDVR